MRQGLRLGDVVIDPVAGQVLRTDGMRRLSARAGSTLVALAEHPGQPVSRERPHRAGLERRLRFR